MSELFKQLEVGTGIKKTKSGEKATVKAVTENSVTIELEGGKVSTLKEATLNKWYSLDEDALLDTELEAVGASLDELPKKKKPAKPSKPKAPTAKKPAKPKKSKVVDIAEEPVVEKEAPKKPAAKKPSKPKTPAKPKAPVAKKETAVKEEKPKTPTNKKAAPKKESAGASSFIADATKELFDFAAGLKGAEKVESKIYTAYKVGVQFVVFQPRNKRILIRVRANALDAKQKKQVKIVADNYKQSTNAHFHIFDESDLKVAKELIKASYAGALAAK